MCLISCKSDREQLISYNNVEIELQSADDVTLSSGTLQIVEKFPSKFITPREVYIWLPDGYSKDKKYAVLYMHDGQMLFDADLTWNKQEWMVDEVASKLIKENRVQDFMVVAPWNISSMRRSDYFPQKPMEALSKLTQDSIFDYAKKINSSLKKLNSDKYLKFLVEELKPFVDSNYSTLNDRNNTFIMGSSMGGLISMYAICEYPEVFGGAACLSTHWIGTTTNEFDAIPEAFFTYMDQKLPDSKTHTLYFDHGTKTLDSLYLPYQTRVNSVLNQKGFTKNMRFEGHDHSENSWQKRLDVPLTYLLGKHE